MARSNPFVKIAVVVVLLAGLGVLFIRSLRSDRARPYTVAREQLTNWTVVMPAGIAARRSDASPCGRRRTWCRALFSQVFSRTMESLRSPDRIGHAAAC